LNNYAIARLFKMFEEKKEKLEEGLEKEVD